jgi:hypothetical protein
MNSEEVRKTAEDLLDERQFDDALAHYGSAEPRVGLETRILSGIEAHIAQRRRRWIYAFAAAAAVVVFALWIANVEGFRLVTPPRIARPMPESAGEHPNPTNAAMNPSQQTSVARAHEQRATARENVTSGATPMVATDVKPFAASKQLLAQKRSFSRPVLAQSSSQEQGSVITPQRSAPEIFVSDLKAIQPIEIRELVPVKEIN